MERHANRRVSRGWVEEGAGVEVEAKVEPAAVLVEGGPTGAGEVSLLRSVSGNPGAEGAPRDGCGRQMGIWVVLEVVVGWAGWGVMRRDWLLVSWMV